MLELRSQRLDGFAGAPGRHLAICGQSLLADNSGAIYWPSEAALLVADLSLDTATAGAEALPPEPAAPREVLIRLAEVIDRYEPRRVIALGGAVAAAGGAHRISADDLVRLGILQEEREWIWVGDHLDDGAARQPGGRVAKAIELAGISVRHRPIAASVTPEIAGHLNPAATLSHYGTTIRRPCFVANRRRLILPAFGAFAGGRNVLDDAFLPLFGDGGMAVWLLGQDGPYAVASRRLSDD